MVSLWNRTDNAFKIKHKNRLAQIVFIKTESPSFKQVAYFDKTERGSNGFGKSGVK